MRIVDWGGGLTARARRSLVRAVAVLLLGNAAALVAVPDGSTSPVAPTEAAGDPTAAGDGGDAPTGAAPGTPTTTAASSSRPAGGGEGGDAEGADPQAATTTTTAAAALPAPGSEWKGDYRFEITLEPTCARVGELFTVTVRVERDANVALIAAHADGQTYGTRQIVTAPEDGVVVRSWRAPPAPGPGRLLVGSTTPGGRSGGTPVDFRVAEATGSC